MTDRVDLELQGVFIDQSSPTAVMLLGEVTPADRVLPIFIDPVEAAAITDATEPEALVPSTHDVLIGAVRAVNARLGRVDVAGLDDGMFLARLQIESDDATVGIDIRPSDGVALAVRNGMPIGIDRGLFERAAVDVRAPDHRSFVDDVASVDEVERVVDEFRRFLDNADPLDFADPLESGGGDDEWDRDGGADP